MKPTLFVLAAGMGSRYGGLKQLDPVGPHGETIMDYSIYDAVQSGFGKVVFVIRHDFEDDFKNKIVKKYKDFVPVEIVFQSLDELPEGFELPADRTKPWGTNHAVLMGADAIKEPFAVINADDFYGRPAFRAIAAELSAKDPAERGKYCMVAFRVSNTMSESGTVSRGVCTPLDGNLFKIVERTAIGYNDKHEIEFTDFEGCKQTLSPDTPVSMNFWGFTPDYFDFSKREFVRFLNKYIADPKREYFIPSVVDKLIRNGEASVKILDTESRWFGVTYPADRQNVVDQLARLHSEGEYPERLFG